MKSRIAVFVSILFLSISSAWSQQMDSEGLKHILDSKATEIEGGGGAWSFTYDERPMLLLTDESFNRMRVISPIDDDKNLTESEIYNALMANFHSALDVKYAISDDIMWSVFIHPLKELSEGQFSDALQQVSKAAETFGSTYSSTDLIFPGNSEEKPEPREPSKQKKKT